MNEIKNRGHEVVFCAAQDEYTHKLQSLGFRYIPIKLERKGMNVFKDLLLLFSLVKIYKKEEPDWIFHNSTKPFLYGTIAASLAGRRCINTHSGLGHLFVEVGFLTNFLLIFYKFAGFYATKTFFQNKDDLQLFLNKKLIDSKKCVLVPGSGVNIDYYKPGGNKNRREGFVFLYMGRIIWDKGISDLVDSARTLKERYPSMKINFLGMIDSGNPSGISRFQVEEWVKEGLIDYLGEAVDVRPYLENCDCVILPTFYREGVPKSLMEAAAMELPIIASDVPGCRAVVTHGVNGFIVKVRNSFELTKAMDMMMKMPEPLRKEMGRNGRLKVIQECSEGIVIKAYCAQIGI